MIAFPLLYAGAKGVYWAAPWKLLFGGTTSGSSPAKPVGPLTAIAK